MSGGLLTWLALGGFALLAFVCIAANLIRKHTLRFYEIMDEALGYRPDGDWPALPDDLKAIPEHVEPSSFVRRGIRP